MKYYAFCGKSTFSNPFTTRSMECSSQISMVQTKSGIIHRTLSFWIGYSIIKAPHWWDLMQKRASNTRYVFSLWTHCNCYVKLHADWSRSTSPTSLLSSPHIPLPLYRIFHNRENELIESTIKSHAMGQIRKQPIQSTKPNGRINLTTKHRKSGDCRNYSKLHLMNDWSRMSCENGTSYAISNASISKPSPMWCNEMCETVWNWNIWLKFRAILLDFSVDPECIEGMKVIFSLFA